MNANKELTKPIVEADDVRKRKSSQYQMPRKIDGPVAEQEEYNIYPVCHLGDDRIYGGFSSLAEYISEQGTVIIDGYVGIFWDDVISRLTRHLADTGLSVNFFKTSDYLRTEKEINNVIEPFLGTADSVWGTRCTMKLEELYREELFTLTPDKSHKINIIIGCGAGLAGWNAPIIYFDLPKNELQFRMRAGSITNLGSTVPFEATDMYKRFYFVDWVLLNEHKKNILDRIEVIADGQWEDSVNWMFKEALTEGLNRMSHSVIRVRPWFEPGAWGGQWIKNHIGNLNKDVINYAWSFELIVPENGLIFESSGYLQEVSFDFLMLQCQNQVLGNHASRFGSEFPIRFDFLDTFDGGNLSIQVHPKLQYIQEVFGENLTQDETYYVMDAKDDAKVYLGFQDDINAGAFRSALEKSQDEGVELSIEDFVQSFPSRKHDLFLIPNGTIHSSGTDNLVLEISATPYIFTFKMYDWLRPDLDGKPRPINIDHAFNNLDFERKGDKVQQELISKPRILQEGADWRIVHLPTHSEHFYDIHRLEFDKAITIDTDNCCHVMMLVEGTSVQLKTADGTSHVFAYAETFVIPAAARSYELVNLGAGTAKIIKAFLK